MRIPRIYTQVELHPDTLIELESQASHHLSKVLRFKQGAAIILFNGKGGEYQATIDSISKKNLIAKIGRHINTHNESSLHLHLGIGISRGERIELVMQKSTELGVNEITPLFTERSEVKLKGDRLEKKIQHWKKIITSACEQCGRTQIPTLNSIQPMQQWSQKVVADRKWVLHHRTDQRLDTISAINSAALLIGPEGGLSQEEIAYAQEYHFSTLSLGPRILRTETAPLAAITLLQHHWGDM